MIRADLLTMSHLISIITLLLWICCSAQLGRASHVRERKKQVAGNRRGGEVSRPLQAAGAPQPCVRTVAHSWSVHTRTKEVGIRVGEILEQERPGNRWKKYRTEEDKRCLPVLGQCVNRSVIPPVTIVCQQNLYMYV